MKNNKQQAAVDLKHPYIKNRVVILNGFTDQEIIAIMRTVKGMCQAGADGQAAQITVPATDLVFAKSTPTSLQTRLGDLIIDMSGDHEYLRNNPPPRKGQPA